MSATRTFRKLETVVGSVGGCKVTLGLSSVGPPPGFMMIQLFAALMMHGFSSRTTCPSRTSAYHARERATSLTVRKCVNTRPLTGGTGRSLVFIVCSLASACRRAGRSAVGWAHAALAHAADPVGAEPQRGLDRAGADGVHPNAS